MIDHSVVSSRFRRHTDLIPGIALVAVVALGLTSCGGSSANQDELDEARQSGANHAQEQTRLRNLEKELKHIKHGGSSTPTTPGTGSAPVPVQSSPSNCGGELSVGSATSCPFAENVKSVYFEEIGSGSGTVEVYSPVTGKYYSMYCTGSPHECTGGNNASVYFP